MKLIELNSKINHFLDTQNLRDATEIENLLHECSITDSKKLQQKLAEINNTDRVLRIGIIGRVKAGKSSLLNALVFDGQDILPKAATPMTAALTRLAYTEDAIRAEIDFYSETDIQEIHTQAQRYQTLFEEAQTRCLNELKKKSKERKTPNQDTTKLQIDAQKSAEAEMARLPELQAASEQSERIKSSATDVAALQEQAQISAKKTDELMGKLNDYVGATGKYMPFTKSVTLYLPEKGLEGLEVVDTPGINDPVRSREERTNEFLALCDVVLVVSPAGQFISQEDIDLMGRITTREGIQEAYIIASQTDNQLFGNEKRGETSPINVLAKITEKLNAHATGTLSKNAAQQPEMKTVVELYQKHSVIATSSVAYTLSQHLNDKQQWDANTQTVWSNLSQHYPDFFNENNQETARSVLQSLANIDKIRSIFTDVKTRKAQIQTDKRNKLQNDTVQSFRDFLAGVKTYINNRMTDIESADIAEEKEKLQKLKERERETSDLIDDEYQHLIDKMDDELSNQLLEAVKKETHGFDDKNQTQTESVAYHYDEEEGGFWNSVKSFFGGSRSTRRVTDYRDETTIQAGQVVRIIKDSRRDIGRKLNTICANYKEEWDDRLTKAIFSGMREIAEGERVNRRQITRAIRVVLRRVPKSEFQVKDNLPDAVDKSGKLTGQEAKDFERAARDYVYEQFIPALEADIKVYITETKNALSHYNLPA